MSIPYDDYSLVLLEEDDDSNSYDEGHGGGVCCALEDDDQEDDEDGRIMKMLLHRPIVVGYSFGPKKMSTMGVVMAEASKTGLSTNMIATLPQLFQQTESEASSSSPLLPALLQETIESEHGHSSDEEQEDADNEESKFVNLVHRDTLRTTNLSLTSEVLSSFTDEQRKEMNMQTGNLIMANEKNNHGKGGSCLPRSCLSVKKSSPSSLEGGAAAATNTSADTRKALPSSVWFFSEDHRYGESSTSVASVVGTNSQYSPLHHPHHNNNNYHPRRIVRHLQSTPSVSSWGSTGTRTASTAASNRTISVSGATASCGPGATNATGTTADSSSLTRTSTTTAGSLPRASSSSRCTNKAKRKVYPIRVSFVPLDAEIPLEEQHGGIDVILHKLTEDILMLSQLSVQHPKLKTVLERKESPLPDDVLLKEFHMSESEASAIRRVHRLTQFQKLHGCSLVDDPICVQTLMSRADIARVLKECLSGVTSLSGIPVHSPKFAVVTGSMTTTTSTTQHSSNNGFKDDMLEIAQKAQLSFPLIVKPLTAAGTKASHSMAVVSHPSGLEHIVDRTPCLLQEYVNHDAVLYKIYVLGDFVSVYKRRSLPNLPSYSKMITSPQTDAAVVVEFDSQRPYPRLKDFGYRSMDEHATSQALPVSSSYHNNNMNDNDCSRANEPAVHSSSSSSFGTTTSCVVNNKNLEVTAEEVRPIVHALKEAFGLEIFGFDVLITSSSSITSTTNWSTSNDSTTDDATKRGSSSTSSNDVKRSMLVVDVNYFPSYKEVPDFPALLAKFLTGRAIQSRLKRIGAISNTF